VTAYVAVFRARFATLLQYRAAAVSGLVTQVFWGFVRIMILGAFYRSAAGAHPMTHAECVTYVWLGQGLIMLLPWRAEPEVQRLVRTGDVAYELVRPVGVYRLWYARSLAARTAPTLLRVVPLYLLAILFFGMDLPASPAGGLAFAATLLGALLLATAITTVVTVCLLWTISGTGLTAILAASVWIFSGMTIPLPLFPDWAQPVLDLLPFRGLMDLPFRLYLGHLPASAAPGVLAHQLAWTGALVLFGRWLVGRGTRRLVVQGG
jgi:ABC-2 type transport system permease protein